VGSPLDRQGGARKAKCVQQPRAHTVLQYLLGTTWLADEESETWDLNGDSNSGIKDRDRVTGLMDELTAKKKTPVDIQVPSPISYPCSQWLDADKWQVDGLFAPPSAGTP
jgi:hypothetical protein